MKSFRILIAAFASVLSPAALAQTAPARVEIANGVQPQLTASADGTVWLVYAKPVGEMAAKASGHGHQKGAHADGKKGKGGHGAQGRMGDVFVTGSKDGGATFAPAVKVAHVMPIMLGNRRGPRIAAHGDRITVTVVGRELFAYTSGDGGKSWSGPVTINDVPNSAHEGLHDLVGSREGELFITWLDLRNGKTELWGASSRDGGRSWGKNQLVYKSPDKSICECCHPSVLFDADGNLAVMWRNSIENSRDMWLMTRAKGASQFSAARKLGEGTWKINGCPHDGGALVALGGGKFGAVAQRAGEVFLYWPQAAEMALGKGRQPIVISDDKGPLVIWQDGTDLVSLRDWQGATPAKHASNTRFPSAVGLPGGKGAVVAYERDSKENAGIAIERL